MTIGAWVFVGIIALCGIGIALFLFWMASVEQSKGMTIGAVFTLIVTVALCGLFIWYRSNSASGQRALKDQKSNLSGGIERTVSVYDINGELIEQYSGRFDIETDRESYILFDDEQGKRHIIYYTTGTIIVDEK